MLAIGVREADVPIVTAGSDLQRSPNVSPSMRIAEVSSGLEGGARHAEKRPTEYSLRPYTEAHSYPHSQSPFFLRQGNHLFGAECGIFAAEDRVLA